MKNEESGFTKRAGTDDGELEGVLCGVLPNTRRAISESRGTANTRKKIYSAMRLMVKPKKNN